MKLAYKTRNKLTIFQGRFRAGLSNPASVVCADKWAVFKSIPITKQVVEDVVSQRLRRIQSETVDLLQFHWQDVSFPDLDLASIYISFTIVPRRLLNDTNAV